MPALRVFFVSDIHGASRCFRKLLNTLRTSRKPDVLIVGGDITGKYIVPIVSLVAGRWVAYKGNSELTLDSEAELAKYESQAADFGTYTIRLSRDDFTAAIAMGSSVFCCDNLAFSAEVTIARRHTRFIERDLPRIVHTAVGRLADMRGQQDSRIRTYKETQLSDPAVHDLVIRAVDATLLPVTQVPAVLEEWRTPSHEEFAADGKTVWRFHNAMTHIWKGRNLAALPRRSQALHGLLDTVCGLAV